MGRKLRGVGVHSKEVFCFQLRIVRQDLLLSRPAGQPLKQFRDGYPVAPDAGLAEAYFRVHSYSGKQRVHTSILPIPAEAPRLENGTP